MLPTNSLQFWDFEKLCLAVFHFFSLSQVQADSAFFRLSKLLLVAAGGAEGAAASEALIREFY